MRKSQIFIVILYSYVVCASASSGINKIMESSELNKAAAISAYMSEKVMPVIIENCSEYDEAKAAKIKKLHEALSLNSKELIKYGEQLSKSGFEQMSAEDINKKLKQAVDKAANMSQTGNENQSVFCDGQLEMLEFQSKL